MSVFIPAAFLPGLTGQLYRQFALVIAATAFISAINAVTLKPTQSALWLRAPTPPERRNFFYRGFNVIYGLGERAYVRLIGAMTRRSGAMVFLSLILAGVGIWGLTRVPTAFLPDEDQGYLIVGAQLPVGASKERTDAVMQQVSLIAKAIPGVDHVVAISGVSLLDNLAPLTNAGVAFVILNGWDARLKEKDQDLASIDRRLNGALQQEVMAATAFATLPPPIQGIGNVSGFTMQVEIKNGDLDYTLLESLAQTVVNDGRAQSALARLSTTFRADAPQLNVIVNRTKAETLGITVGNVFSALSTYVGSNYLAQVDKFGHVFQVYTQALPNYRATVDDISNLKVKAGDGTMTPIGTVVEVKQVVGPALITLYNLYPSATIIGSAARGFSSGQALDIMDQIGTQALPVGTGYQWTAMSYQEKAVGSQIYFVFGFALLLVYFVLAGQYESWILPLSVIFAVPLALLGVVGGLTYLGEADNLYTQIGLILLIALASKNAILIVEYARQQRAAGAEVLDAAVEAARLRFRPIIMTSFAFILGVFPLVIATGAGAASRRSIGIAVFSGMIASTCLAVVFVPSFYVVLQRFHERTRGRRVTLGDAPSARRPVADSPPSSSM
jgi:hydrophobic/amphiphilic exporter-1 (mainly G- bacteria), HAE1 family